MEDSEKDLELEDRHHDYDDENAEVGASDHSFNLAKEPEDGSGINYDRSMDH